MKFGIKIFQIFSPHPTNIKLLILRWRDTNNYKRSNDMPMKMKRGVCGEGQVTL
jgi:hypothetical protein